MTKSLRHVAALFVRADSIYKTLNGVIAYDSTRDAQSFDGCSAPVVAHPPCRTWGRLRHFAKAPSWEHELALWAVDTVRHCGGVLEHPASSTLWPAAGLPGPGDPTDEFGGYTIQVDQFHWGHRARKRTWLYIVRCPIPELPPFPHQDGSPERVISTRRADGTELRECTKREREATPQRFAEWLVAVARRSHPVAAGCRR